MNAAIWIGIVVDVALLAWFIVSVRQIKEYLRRIALSLPVSPEQMKLINGTISTEEAMAQFEKAGGTFQIEIVDYAENSLGWLSSLDKIVLWGTPRVRPSNAGRSSSDASCWDVVMSNTEQVEPELVLILKNRKSKIHAILKSRPTSNP